MKINQQIRCFSIFLIIALVCGCNQVSNTSNVASNDEDSYLSKKSYQKRFTSWLHPYKIDVQQGNLISKDMMENVKVGMSKEQVRHTLGTSILTDNFEQDRWIYAFSNATNGTRNQEHVLVLSFKDNKLSDIVENTIINKQNS